MVKLQMAYLPTYCMICEKPIDDDEDYSDVYADTGMLGTVHEKCFEEWIHAPRRFMSRVGENRDTG